MKRSKAATTTNRTQSNVSFVFLASACCRCVFLVSSLTKMFVAVAFSSVSDTLFYVPQSASFSRPVQHDCNLDKFGIVNLNRRKRPEIGLRQVNKSQNENETKQQEEPECRKQNTIHAFDESLCGLCVWGYV